MFGGSFTGSGCPPGSVQVEDTLHWFPHQGDNWFALMFSSDFASVFGDMYHFDQASKSCHLELGFYVPDGWQFSISGLTYDLGLSLSPNVTAIQSTAFSFSQDSLNPSQSTRKGTIWRGPIRGDSLFAEVAIPESKQTWSQCNTIALPAANLKQDLVPPFLMPARDHFSTVILSIQSSNKIVSDTVFGKLARTAVKGSSQAGTASAATEIDLHEALYQLVEYGKFTTDTFDEIRHTFKMNWRRC